MAFLYSEIYGMFSLFVFLGFRYNYHRQPKYLSSGIGNNNALNIKTVAYGRLRQVILPATNILPQHQ